ncbi:GNAT family N-acetyltransferase [Pseudoalteromonas sp. JBTF-M23]|uniref:GNAT family N-acetyltransferase n=1 Tax=Pseudoalteromonas caenipelagi TaxID=2726988 RepID=A0A849VI46_9GAMM|nr:GNAT family N-acetyltransferase [Pseudoalteromonas caenipelagi]NOU52490.1 GNAT family N-acetyltransferase [Pseudoalteromonas caenipelagi]
MKIELTVSPTQAQLNAISRGIAEFNAQYLPNDNSHDTGLKCVITVQDDNEQIIGGLQASVVWSHCVLELLWLSEQVRGKGVGTQLMQYLEQFAKQHNLYQIRTETLDFQAKPFYEKLGFKVYGELENTPPGHTSYFLVKQL